MNMITHLVVVVLLTCSLVSSLHVNHHVDRHQHALDVETNEGDHIQGGDEEIDITKFTVSGLKYEQLRFRFDQIPKAELFDEKSNKGVKPLDSEVDIVLDGKGLNQQTKIVPLITTIPKQKYSFANTIEELGKTKHDTGKDIDAKEGITLNWKPSVNSKKDLYAEFWISVGTIRIRVEVSAVYDLTNIDKNKNEVVAKEEVPIDKKSVPKDQDNEVKAYEKELSDVAKLDAEKFFSQGSEFGVDEFSEFGNEKDLENMIKTFETLIGKNPPDKTALQKQLDNLKTLIAAIQKADKDKKEEQEKIKNSQKKKSLMEISSNIHNTNEVARARLDITSLAHRLRTRLDKQHDNHISLLQSQAYLNTRLKLHANFETPAEQLAAIRVLLNHFFTIGGYLPGNPAATPAVQYNLIPVGGANVRAQWRGVLNWDRVRSWSRNVRVQAAEVAAPFLIQGGGGGTSASGSTFATSQPNQAFIIKSMREVDIQAYLAARPNYQAHMEGSWDAGKNSYSSKIMRLALVIKFVGVTPKWFGPNEDAYWQVMVSGIPGGKGKWTRDPARTNCDYKHYRAGHESRAGGFHTGCLDPLVENTNTYGSVDIVSWGTRINLFNRLGLDYLFLKQEALIDHSLLYMKLRPTLEFTREFTMDDVNDWSLLGYNSNNQRPPVGPPLAPIGGAAPANPWQTWAMATDFLVIGIIDILMPYAARDTGFYVHERSLIGWNFNTCSRFIQDQYRKAWQFATMYFLRGPTNSPYLRTLWLQLAGGAAINFQQLRRNAINGNNIGAGNWAQLPVATITQARLKKTDVTTGYDIPGVHGRDGEEVWTAPVVNLALDWNRACE